ncbi:pentatricopeptide repeat-containing protein At1g30610, chloroplastic [Typha angustifolia]|uniref:pentatricopeptide repeat-containing protein At1g30610, chloroplastic n=1 Tax=Typha angustifolia TaxID=59011 RepID=UPI003C2CBE7F
MMMMMANGHMGVLNLGGKGAFLPDSQSRPSYARGFSVSRKPIFGITLNCVVVKKSWVFDGRTSYFRVVNALENGQMEGRSTSLRSLEKELNFSPTFADYVKVMESVKLDRCKNLDGDSDGRGSNNRLNGKDAAGASDVVDKRKSVKVKRGGLKEKVTSEKRKNGEEIGLNAARIGRQRRDEKLKDVKDREDDVTSSNSGWNLVERLLKDKTAAKSGGSLRRELDKGGNNDSSKSGRKINSKNKISRTEGMENITGYKRQKDTQQNELVDKFQDYNRMKSELGRGNSEKIGDVEMRGSSSGSVGREVGYASSKELHGKHLESTRDLAQKHASGTTGNNHIIYHHRDNKFYPSNVGRKMDADEKNKSSRDQVMSSGAVAVTKFAEPEITEGSLSKKFDRTNRHEKSIQFDGHNSKWKDDSSLGTRQKKMETGLRRSELPVIQVDTHPSICSLDPKRKLYSPVKQVPEQDSNFRRAHRDAKVFGKHRSGPSQMHGESDMQTSKIIRRDINELDFEDRAAFKTFEVFTDVRNRPRVLRMEMEERIRNLASQLNATDVNMPEWQFSKMMHGANIKFSDHSILRVVQILGKLGNWKRVLQVVEWLQSHERFKSYKSRYIYTTVLDVLGKAKRPFEALNIFHSMRQELSSYPDLAAYHCIAVTLGQAGLMKELFDVIDCMRSSPQKKYKLGPLQKWDPRLEPDLIVYNAVLNACVQQKQWEGAFWVLQQLKEQGIRPTNTTYGLVMEVMLASGKYNLVHEFFRKVERSSIPGALNYKVLINALWREGKIDEAALAVKDMERRGIVGSASIYYDFARCLCSAGRCQEALLQIDKICKVAKKPLVVTYTGLIQTCLDSGNIENGRYIFNQMHNFCSPNIVTCNIMLKSYIEHGLSKEAKDLFYNILDSSRLINSKTYLSKKVVPDKFTFNTMMEACAKTEDWDDFENVFRQMLRHGYHFDTRRHLRMVLDAFRAGKEQVLEVTWEHLITFGRIPPLPLIMERFCLKLKEDFPMAAISCISSYKETEINTVSENSWLQLLWNNASCLKKDTVVKLADELRKLLVSPNNSDPLYQNILNACTQFLSDQTTSEPSSTNQQTPFSDLRLRT